MRKLILALFVCLLAGSSFGQKGNGYAEINGTFNISKPLGNGAGGAFGVGSFVNKNTSIGAGFEISKLKNLSKITPAVYADLRYYFGTGIKKPLLYFSLTPGYLFFSDSYNILINQSYNYYNYKGGFLIGAGLGVILYQGKKVAPFLSVKYNNFPLIFKGENSQESTRYDIIKISFGLKF
jgi:hypothetical protein